MRWYGGQTTRKTIIGSIMREHWPGIALDAVISGEQEEKHEALDRSRENEVTFNPRELAPLHKANNIHGNNEPSGLWITKLVYTQMLRNSSKDYCKTRTCERKSSFGGQLLSLGVEVIYRVLFVECM